MPAEGSVDSYHLQNAVEAVELIALTDGLTHLIATTRVGFRTKHELSVLLSCGIVHL
jgi:hypothetical protein